MDTSMLGSVLPVLEETPDVSLVVAAMPDDMRARVDALTTAIAAHDVAAPAFPGNPQDVVRAVAQAQFDAVTAGRPFDLVKVSSKAVSDFDAGQVAYYVHALTGLYLRQERASYVVGCIPDLFAVWSKRAKVLGAQALKVWQEGVTMDEAVVLRTGGDLADRWRTLTGILEEYLGLVSAFSQARRMSRANDGTYGDVSAYFRDRVRADDFELSQKVREGVPPLVAGMLLGWEPWFATFDQQAEAESMERQRRKAA